MAGTSVSTVLWVFAFLSTRYVNKSLEEKRLDYIDVSNTWKTLAVLGFVLAVACFCGGALALAFNLGMSKNT